MTDRELLELIATQVGTLAKDMVEVKKDMVEVKKDMVEVKKDVAEVKTRVIYIENEHGLKLGFLLDGYTQNADKLDRIEKIVAKHDEELLKKVK